jgi:hypothetical protein
VFVDHLSRLRYVHMQQQLTSNETVEVKHAFEAFARYQGATIKHYHAYNGRFGDNAFMKYVREDRPSQSISFCGVNTHFQNGIAEKKIFIKFGYNVPTKIKFPCTNNKPMSQ